MDELSPCPFCGGKPNIRRKPQELIPDTYSVYCPKCLASTFDFFSSKQQAVNAWNTRYKEGILSYAPLIIQPITRREREREKMESHIEFNTYYDEEEVIENCTVQIWRNSITGEESVGWWRGKKEDMPIGGAE